MKKTQTPIQTPSQSVETIALSPDAQSMRDLKTSIFIVSVMINVLVFLFWLTVQVVQAQA